MDRRGYVLGWNRQAEKAFGFRSDEAIGRLLTDLIVPAEHRASQQASFARLAAASDAGAFNRRNEIHAQNCRRQRLIVEVSISPVYRGGVATTFSAFLREVTEARRDEETKRQLSARVRQVHLSGVVTEALKLLRASLPSSIEIRSQLARDRAMILADASRIHQIVMNLGTNAAHAMQVHGGVRSHAGVIAVTSEPGRGTTFQIHFPVYEVRTPAFGISAVPRAIGGHERVLLVDDEQAVARILERFGYRVTFHTDPTEALAAFRERLDGFDLVISDLTMPGLSGLDLAREVRALRPALPVILTSGYVDDDTLARAHALGVREVLLKPVMPDQLAEAVRAAVTGNAGEPA